MKTYPLLTAAGAIVMVAAIGMVFEFAPLEREMGAVQKIFYFHVASAWLCYLGFILCAVGSIAYLWGKGAKWDLFALTSAEAGLLFGLIVLVTGPLWARPAWGVWWKWEPRLTSLLLLFLLYAAYWVLRTYGGDSEGVRRFAAALGIFGAPNIYFVHVAVQRWRGYHPPNLIASRGGLDPDMRTALWVALAASTLLFALLVRLRYRAHADARAVRSLRRRLARLGGP